MNEGARETVEMMHSEGWWIRALDHDLTPAEQRAWEAHLMTCESCRVEWSALAVVDRRLRSVGVPRVPSRLAERVVTRTLRAQRRLRLLRYAVASLLVVVVSLVLLGLLGTTVAEIEREVAVLVSARQSLLRSLIQIVLALVFEWKILLPYIVALTVLTYLLMMPNSVLVALAILWLTWRRGGVKEARSGILRGRGAPTRVEEVG